jgi:hypothetical protein
VNLLPRRAIGFATELDRVLTWRECQRFLQRGLARRCAVDEHIRAGKVRAATSGGREGRCGVCAPTPAPRVRSLPREGKRFRAECRLAGKLYGDPFGVDVAFGDPMLGPPETAVADDLLGFAGIAPPTLRLYPVETHIAEKFHAFTMPRARPNSRLKDLPDIALLAGVKPLDAARLRAALEQTFAFRKTHALPAALPPPPVTWETPYAAMAREDRLAWATSTRDAAAGA